MRLARRIRLCCTLGLAAALLATELVVAAEHSGTNDAAPPHTVPAFLLVTVPAAVQPPASLEARVLSWFSADDVKVEGQHRRQLDPERVLAGPTEPGVQVWLVPRTTTMVRLFFSVKDPAFGGPIRYLVTDFELPGGFDELGLEQVSQVIYLSATALWEGRLESSRQEVERGLSDTTVTTTTPSAVPRPVNPKPEARRPASTRPLANPKRDGLSPRIGLEYSVRLRGEEGVAQGPGGAFSLSSGHGALALGVRAHAGLLLPSRTTRRQVELELRGYSCSLGPLLTLRLSEKLWLNAEVGVGADVIRFAASAASESGWTTSEPVWQLRPLIAGSVGAQTELGWLRLGVTVGVAFQLQKTSYDVAEPSGHSELLAPWNVQPGAAAELSW